jgi:EAL domain-containing protein (putative c-di-GMP-specific phosphodiesterase class I)
VSIEPRSGAALIAGGWAVVSGCFMLAPHDVAATLCVVLLVVQAAWATVVVRRRWSTFARPSAWWAPTLGMWLIVASIALSGNSLVAPDPADFSLFAAAIGAGGLTCEAFGALRMLQPLLESRDLRRSYELGLGGYIASAIPYVWAGQTTSLGELLVLGIVAGAGSVCCVASTLMLSAPLRRAGRPAELMLMVAGSAFSLQIAVGLVLRSQAWQAPLLGAAMISTNGAFLAALSLPQASVAGMKVELASDRRQARALPVALSAAVLAAGGLGILRELSRGRIIVLVLGAAAVVQLVVLVSALTMWWESDDARSWIRHRVLARDIAKALVRGQIVPHYQPIVRASDAEPVGYEALARWNHPRRGLLSAGQFLEIAERRGYMAAIDRRIFLVVARDLPSLLSGLDDSVDPFVTVNLSPRRLAQQGYAASMLQLLEREGLVADGLMIEMTEASSVVNWASFNANVSAFAQAGIGLAIDDFGAGHANLTLLCELEVDVVKLDRAVVELAITEAGSAIVYGAVAAARAAGALIVAEGVEDGSWAARLGQLGVDFVQGYGIGLPAGLADLVPLLHGQSSV